MLAIMDPENKKYRFRIQGVKHNILKMFQICSRLISDLSWKFHENPFIASKNHLSAMSFCAKTMNIMTKN